VDDSDEEEDVRKPAAPKGPQKPVLVVKQPEDPKVLAVSSNIG
jgi:hypothetical protein